jgi:hypothetical protein
MNVSCLENVTHLAFQRKHEADPNEPLPVVVDGLLQGKHVRPYPYNSLSPVAIF